MPKNRFSDKDFITPAMCSTGGDPFDCVAVAMDDKGVAVRSTLDEDKTTLYFSHNEWDNFINAVRQGNFSAKK